MICDFGCGVGRGGNLKGNLANICSLAIVCCWVVWYNNTSDARKREEVNHGYLAER